MGLPSFARHEIIAITPAIVHVNGADRPDYSKAAASRETIKGCWATPGPSEDEDEHAEGVIVQWTVLLPPDAEGKLDYDSHVDLYGIEYAVDGRPKPRPSPTGRVAHLAVALITTEG